MRILPFLPALALGFSLSAQSADISVGAAGTCNAHSIAEAIALAKATPEADTIRLANDQAYLDQTAFIDTAVDLVGGHAACGDTVPTGRTALVGTGEWATLSIWGGEGIDSFPVRIERLDISGGGASGDIGTWGGLNIAGRVLVHVADTAIHHNHNTHGGGLAVSFNAIVTLERNVEIHDNLASVGGGIVVADATLRMQPSAVVVRDNEAIDGGGIAVLSSGLASAGNDPKDPLTPVDGVLVRANHASNRGGGLYVGGANSKALLDDVVLRDNSAAEGGGAFAGDGGYAQFARFRHGPFRHCPSELECLRLSGNIAERGGAVSVRNGGSAHLSEAIVRDNAAAGGSAIWMHGEGSSVRLYSSLVVGNGCIEGAPGCAPIFTMGGSLRFEHSTFADNDGGAALIFGDGEQGAFVTDILGLSSLVSGKDRIFDFFGALPTVRYDCILKDQGTFEVAAERSDILPIAFQAPARGDYRLLPGNAAIDFCDDAPVSAKSPDIDGNLRGIDDPAAQDRFGTYDLGAYESDRIFASGSESKR